MKHLLPWVRIVASLLTFLIVIRLPIFPSVAEMRSFSAQGEELSLEYSVGTLPDFYDDFQFIRAAWTNPPKVIYSALAVANILLATILCLGAVWLLDRALKKIRC